MHSVQPSLFNRPDTILGVCEGIGEDFGFNAQYLRVALAATLFWNPAVAVGAYAVLAVAVLVARKLYPNPVTAVDASEAARPPALRNENDDQPVPVAAAA